MPKGRAALLLADGHPLPAGELLEVGEHPARPDALVLIRLIVASVLARSRLTARVAGCPTSPVHASVDRMY